MRRIIFAIFFLMGTMNLYSQIIIKSDSIYQYLDLNKLYSIRHICIKNMTDQIALCWFTEHKEQIKKDPFYDYFLASRNDFSLYNIITEYGGTLEISDINQFPKLFETFYKVIEPFSIFNVYLLTNNDSVYLEECNIMEIVSLKEIEKYLDNTLVCPFRRLSYKPNYIIIPLLK